MLSDRDLLALLEKGALSITPFSKKQAGSASVDLSLGKSFLRYTGEIDTRANKVSAAAFEADRLVLLPGQFVLATTRERVAIPNGYCGFVETRGNFARAGISVTCQDGHIDPGTDGQITLEIKNHNHVRATLYAGDFVCQLFLFRLSSPSTRPYAGKYALQKGPTPFQK